MGEDLKDFDEEITKQKQIIETAERLRKLEKNKDFQAIIEHSYIQDNLTRLMLEKADPIEQNNAANMAYIDSSIRGIGHLAFFLKSIADMGEQAKDALAHFQKERDTYLEQVAEEEEGGNE